jgi:hypothetical protein
VVERQQDEEEKEKVGTDSQYARGEDVKRPARNGRSA